MEKFSTIVGNFFINNNSKNTEKHKENPYKSPYVDGSKLI